MHTGTRPPVLPRLRAEPQGVWLNWPHATTRCPLIAAARRSFGGVASNRRSASRRAALTRHAIALCCTASAAPGSSAAVAGRSGHGRALDDDRAPQRSRRPSRSRQDECDDDPRARERGGARPMLPQAQSPAHRTRDARALPCPFCVTAVPHVRDRRRPPPVALLDGASARLQPRAYPGPGWVQP